MDRPVTFQVPGVPVAARRHASRSANDTLPSVIDTVAAPTGPLALFTVPDSAPLTGDELDLQRVGVGQGGGVHDEPLGLVAGPGEGQQIEARRPDAGHRERAVLGGFGGHRRRVVALAQPHGGGRDLADRPDRPPAGRTRWPRR